jgi:hypothetical protein
VCGIECVARLTDGDAFTRLEDSVKTLVGTAATDSDVVVVAGGGPAVWTQNHRQVNCGWKLRM